MTVYELIQRLSQEDADKEVVIDFTTRDTTVTVESGLTEGDDMDIDGEEKTGKDIGVSTYSHERYQIVHIEVGED